MMGHCVLRIFMFYGIATFLIILSDDIARVAESCFDVGEDVLECTGLPEIKRGDLNYSNIQYNLCLNRQVDDILNCTEFAVDKYHCRLSPQYQIVVDTDKLFRLMDYVCARYDTFFENAECISQQANNVLKCQEETFEYPDSIATESVNEWLCGWYQHYLSCYTIALEVTCESEAADFVYDFISLSYGSCFPDMPFKLQPTTIQTTTSSQENGLTSLQWKNVTNDPGNNSCTVHLALSCLLLSLFNLLFL